MVSKSTILCLLVTIVTLLELTHAHPDKVGERGTNSESRFFYPSSIKFKPPAPKESLIRKGRGSSLRERFMKVEGGKIPSSETVVITTMPTATTTTTKSPEQIKREKEKEMKIKDPKNIQGKFGKILKKIEEETKEMDKILKEKLQSCSTNEDCFANTCCMKDDPNKLGKCEIRPHRDSQRCTDLCGCNAENLKCTTMISVTDEGVKNIQKQCRRYDTMKDIIAKFKKGKAKGRKHGDLGDKPVKRTKRTGAHKRVVFV